MTPEQQQALAIAQARLRLQQRQAGEADMRRMADPAAGQSGLSNFTAGMGSGMADLAYGAGQRLGMVDQSTIDERAQRDAPLKSTGAGMAGNIGGKVATALPTMFIPGANTVVGSALIGGGMGALEPTATGESVGKNIMTGAAGGAIGQMGANALGRMIRPVASKLGPQQQQLAQSAVQRGIPLDAADLTGSKPLTVMRDVMANMPLTADRQAAIQGAKQGAFNKAVAGTFGESAEQITPQVAQSAKSRLGQKFTDLTARNSLPVDDNLLGRIGEVVEEANRYGAGDVSKVVRNYADDILSRVDDSGVMPGQAYRRLDSAMGRTMRSTSNGDIRNALGQLRGTLREAMDQSISPADSAAWKEARKQYGNLMTVAPLAAKDEAGDVSGRALLAQVLRQNKNAAFTGGGELGELGRIGKAFVAEQTPNSGTAQRLFMQRFLENPLAASYGQAVGGISLPVQTLMNSKAGQSYLTNGLLPVTAQQRALANALGRSTGGSFSDLWGTVESV